MRYVLDGNIGETSYSSIGYVNVFSNRTATSLNISALVGYTLCDVLLIVSASNRWWLFENVDMLGKLSPVSWRPR